MREHRASGRSHRRRILPGLLLLLAPTAAWAGAERGPAPATRSDPFLAMRQRMVEEQIEARGVRDARVLEAMRTVPRHLFVPVAGRERAYDDAPLPIGWGQTISQPYIVAFMTEAATIGPGARVLEIGTGSGYQAAVLAAVGAEVWSIEILPELADRARDDLKAAGYAGVRVRTGDGWQGWPESAPFDAILVTAAPATVPQALVAQLKVGGRMVIPLGTGTQELVRITRTARGDERETLLPVRFVPMTGRADGPGH
ncbi:MAG TPA: protein-L-isoaspartate(D-aspartate) O-methyltransferase [Candidatus Polarisedimenticolia bacterium]|nr:protein-L-isoaspartate(D-aspartate) O-methyltransferase [Candidatus Polarisedimenticolia bacterium]